MVRRGDNANETPALTEVSPRDELSGRSVNRLRSTSRHVDWVAERLTERDWHVVHEVNRLRAASGDQLERLCFTSVRAGRSRTVTRSRVLARLMAWRVLLPVGRRIGGQAKGSTVQVFALDSVGQRLLRAQQLAEAAPVRVRRPEPPGERSLKHLLAVAELYVQLTEQARVTSCQLADFQAEPGAHWPDGLGGRLKPDAYAALERPGARDHWWVEVDLATESLPTIRGKVQTYLDFRQRGGRGPGDVMPWVLISTTTSQRRDAIARLVRSLPQARDFVTVTDSTTAAPTMFQKLAEDG